MSKSREETAACISKLTDTMIAVNSAADDFKAQQQKGIRSQPTIETDWRTWLKKVGPSTFTKEFSFFHAELWEWYWELTQKLRNDEPLTDDDLVFFAIWSRGFGKTSNAEWCAIAEGALIGSGYVLYVSGTAIQAEGHVASIRQRLESEQVAKYYPSLSNPKIGEHGNQHGWGKEFLKTDSGWSIRPVGLDQNIRGVKEGDIRPTLIILDDIDDVNDSPHVVDQKIRKLTGSILPTGTPYTRKIFAQNLIHRNSVLNLAFTRKRDLLQRRIVKGPYPAFEALQIEVESTTEGPMNRITGGRATWPGIDMREVQRFLDDSGKDLFLAEYQHDFSGVDQRRVIPEYDEAVHVVTWSQFEAIFGVRYIPEHWLREVGHDIGYTKEHLSSWSFVATSARNSPFPNLKFLYRGLNFCEPLLDDMAVEVGRILQPDYSVGRRFDENGCITKWKMSHEKKGERMTYRVKYNMPFQPVDFSKSDGIAQWRHYLKSDHKQKHPFLEDQELPDGKFAIGRPSLYYVVDDDQVAMPRNDAGLANHRHEILNWEMRRAVETDTGYSKEQPVKARDDAADSFRMITASWGPSALELTPQEQQEVDLPDNYKVVNIAKVADPLKMQQLYMARQAEIQAQQEKKDHQENGYRKISGW